MKIGLLGDVHGDTAWTQYALDKFHREGIDTIIQLGDFGIKDHESGHRFLKRVRLTMEMYNQKMYVVPGNHEDYEYINSIPIEEDGWQHLRSNIFLAPRAHRWEWDGVSFVALGGAPSVDRSWRMRSQAGKGKRTLWWEEEAITEEDVQATIAGGHANVMLGHDAPFVPGIEAHIAGNPMGFEEVDLAYAYEGRKLMEKAFRGVKPDFFFHGHYHHPINEYVDDTLIVGMCCNGQNFNIGFFDTEAREPVVWDIRSDHEHYMNRR